MGNEQLDVIDFVVNKGNGVKALSDLSLENVPPQYIIPDDEILGQLNIKSLVDELAIPIIDVSNWEDSREYICDAAREWGFFQIINHGIPEEVLENVLDSGHRFFELPVEEKKEYYFRPLDDTCRLKTSFIPDKEKVMEWKDFLTHTYSWQNTNGEEKDEDYLKLFSSWPSVSRFIAHNMSKIQVGYICDVCEWSIFASIKAPDHMFMIKIFYSEHMCAKVGPADSNKQLNNKIFARLVKEFVDNDNSLMPITLITCMMVDYGVHVTYYKAWNAIQITKGEHVGNNCDSYENLERYLEALRTTNLGSRVAFETVNDGIQF